VISEGTILYCQKRLYKDFHGNVVYLQPEEVVVEQVQFIAFPSSLVIIGVTILIRHADVAIMTLAIKSPLCRPNPCCASAMLSMHAFNPSLFPLQDITIGDQGGSD